ncbi:uroporphyrinogen-III synthase [Bacillus sp. FJAT-47783]|uniref:uroporphyrinogen-III synthase n=1 Tax=Bacillus sp. FJAT-47783 TaxID=2922712 RepID=UPI001FADC646|nr:uroporphyrinogen-III synthase [Bacillus sp. FJAT-47783]
MNSGQPLKGVRILNSRAVHQASEFSKYIHKHGGISIEIPLIDIKRSQLLLNVKELFQQLSNEDWLVFTSKNGVEFFREHMKTVGLDITALSAYRIAVVGEKTKQLLSEYHIGIDIMPTSFTAEALVKEMLQSVPASSKIVVVRGNLARPLLRNTLVEHHYQVIDFVAYETTHIVSNEEKLVQSLKQHSLDYLTFTSPSTVHSFMNVMNKHHLKEEWNQLPCVCIGSVTKKAILSHGAKRVLVPSKFTIENMIQTIIEDVKHQKEEMR